MNEIEIKKRKIIFLITGSDVGGAEIVVKNLMFNIDQEKFLPIFVSLRPLGKIGKEIGEKFRVVSLGAGMKFNPIFILRLFSLIKKEKPDILHCHLFHANFLGRIFGKISGVPLIISTIHSDNFGGKLRYYLLKITDSLNDVTVAVSQKIKEDLIKRKISPEHKIKVVYNGTKEGRMVAESDIQKTKRDLSIDNNSPIILSVGRLNPIKGHIYLIEAMELLKIKYPNFKLLLIGDGPERENLENKTKQLCLSENILFLGEIREIDIYYKLADIFVLPSVNEGFGLALIEAMSNRLLVVASRVGGVPEIIKENVTGFMANPGDCKNLASVIEKSLSINSSEKEKIIKNAYQEFKDNFSLDKMMEGYYNIYK